MSVCQVYGVDDVRMQLCLHSIVDDAHEIAELRPEARGVCAYSLKPALKRICTLWTRYWY